VCLDDFPVFELQSHGGRVECARGGGGSVSERTDDGLEAGLLCVHFEARVCVRIDLLGGLGGVCTEAGAVAGGGGLFWWGHERVRVNA
jgi:hypothetical protein